MSQDSRTSSTTPSRTQREFSRLSVSRHTAPESDAESVATTDPMDLDNADEILQSPTEDLDEFLDEVSASYPATANTFAETDETGDQTGVVAHSRSEEQHDNSATQHRQQPRSGDQDNSRQPSGRGSPNNGGRSEARSVSHGSNDEEETSQAGISDGEQDHEQRYRVIEQGEVAHLVHAFRQFPEGEIFHLPAVGVLENTFFENGPSDEYLEIAKESPCYFSSELHQFYSNPPAQRKLLVQDLNKALLVRAEHKAGLRAV